MYGEKGNRQLVCNRLTAIRDEIFAYSLLEIDQEITEFYPACKICFSFVLQHFLILLRYF